MFESLLPQVTQFKGNYKSEKFVSSLSLSPWRRQWPWLQMITVLRKDLFVIFTHTHTHMHAHTHSARPHSLLFHC